MRPTFQKRSEEFLKIADQFQLGVLTTESSHPVTANLSQTAKTDIAGALALLFEADADVLRRYEEFASSDLPGRIADVVVRSLLQGGRIFFTGCGSTGRLSIQLVSIWRAFWQEQRERGPCSSAMRDFEDRAMSVMAGGDFALIKSVEGFEDFTPFGRKQLGELNPAPTDVVFAITEGGETSFVIGTAWRGVEAGAKTYFVYNNPDEVLRRHVQRSREVIDDPRIEKINLTTGPMAITGSTRMQATSIQLAVMLTILEMAARELMSRLDPKGPWSRPASVVPRDFERALKQMHQTLKSSCVTAQLARLTVMEETVYQSGGKNNYFADRFAIDVLTDTTERSPTYCTPPFRKFDDLSASNSWAFLFVPDSNTPAAWHRLLKRVPRCVEWKEEELKTLVPEEKRNHTIEVLRRITSAELMRFRIGLDGLEFRALGQEDCAVGIVSGTEIASVAAQGAFPWQQLASAHKNGAKAGLICFANEDLMEGTRKFLADCGVPIEALLVPVPRTDFLLDGVTRVGLKMLLNALSTCTMVRLGRVMGNYMIWVVPSNLKLIDRATRYIERLAGLDYERSNQLLFEVIEYVEPRMKADRAYPPVVGLAVTRARQGLDNVEAEKRISEQIGARAI